MSEKIMELAKILRESDNIVFFGGAGISTASGIPDFRSSDGLYSKKLNRSFSPEQAVSHSFLFQYPEEFYEFYKANLIYKDAKPNACHKALARLEEMGKLKAVVTQNIDGLHQAAGSKNVFELHGTVLKNYCLDCGKPYQVDYVLEAKGVPTCKDCGAMVRPDVVLYEEGLDQEVLSGAISAISKADTLIIGGTSLVVYPAAGLIHYFRGRKVVQINKTKTTVDEKADLCIYDDIAKVMSEALDMM